MKGIAINVGANSNTSGGRGPIHSDGTFNFVPITENDEYDVSEPTYHKLGLKDARPTSIHDEPAHFDPEFEFDYGENYTYGDRHAIKTREIANLEEGDVLFFFATLDYADEAEPEYDWINTDWGAYIIGHFTLECDPIPKKSYDSLPEDTKERVSTNAHFRRDEFDAEYLVLGDPEDSSLYERAIPLSEDTGTRANDLVSVHSEDSGDGPWYHRVLDFDEDGTRALLNLLERDSIDLDKPSPITSTKFEPSHLGNKGQLQFFYHASESELPVRDIVGRNKTEPHIEEHAENYCNNCYQNNIRGFLKNDDRRYLFLFTNCQNNELEEHYDQRHIVGYIEKEHKLDMGNHWAVQGRTQLVRFEDAVPLSKVSDSPRYVRMKKFSEETTQRIVNQLDNGQNVLDECLNEVNRLKELRREQKGSSGVAPPSDSGGC